MTQKQQIRINPDDLEDLTCECGGEYFYSIVKFGKISAILSPTGEEGIVPLGQKMACKDCGKIQEL